MWVCRGTNSDEENGLGGVEGHALHHTLGLVEGVLWGKELKFDACYIMD